MTRPRFRVEDATTGKPVSGLRPAAWMSRRAEGAKAPDDAACRENVKKHAAGLLSVQADVDLNSYLIWTLNHDNTLSVIDPLVSFSKTKTRAVVALAAPGDDWTFGPGERSLYVSMSAADKVAIVDAARYRVVTSVDVGRHPGRVVASPDGASVWVANDQDGTISVVDTATASVVKTLPAGAGAHDFTTTGDGRWLWAAATDADGVRVYDMLARQMLVEIPVPRGAVAIAASKTAGAVYVAHASGEVTAIDSERRTATARLHLDPGLSAVAFDRSGRWAIVTNRDAGLAHLVDAATTEVRDTVRGLAAPRAVSVTERFAYVVNGASERVTMLQLDSLAKGAPLAATEFVAGQHPPDSASRRALAPSVAPDPAGDGVIVASPPDRALFVYREGMMAPMGTLLNFGREPLAVAVQDRSMKEARPGEYAAVATIEQDGTYDVEILFDTPRVAMCFEHVARSGRAAARDRRRYVLRDAAAAHEPLAVGVAASVVFRVLDAESDAPFDAPSLPVVFFRVPYQWRGDARRRADGAYEVTVTPEAAGRHTLSLGRVAALGPDAVSPLTIDVVAAGPAGAR